MMESEKVETVVVVGGLNTDIVGLGFERLLGSGEVGYGAELRIGPGGKSRNVAQMIATLTGPGSVGMVGRTSCDPYGLWKVPMDALREVGVNTRYVKAIPFEEAGKLPGIALIPVEKSGGQQIYVVPGANEDFSAADVEEAEPLFRQAGKAGGLLAMSLELPYDAALKALQMAEAAGLRVVLDLGGIRDGRDYSGLFERNVFLAKPNEHEARLLTGVEITDSKSVERAGADLLSMGIDNVLLTAGADGAYLIDKQDMKHFPAPVISGADTRDATGCGDQLMAGLCAALIRGCDMDHSIRAAVLAGTLQFFKQGIQPVSLAELAGHGLKI